MLTKAKKNRLRDKQPYQTLVFESTRIIKVVVLKISWRGGKGGYKREGERKLGEINK